MTPSEQKAATLVGLVMSIRMLGLFMILPVFTLFAHSYLHVTEHRIGMALGVYGLTQAIMQIPFGVASDVLGRKRMIYLGLGLFILGSIICAFAESIFLLIVGRALQGAGAIGSVLLALMADLTRPQHRTKAMAIVGLSIGVSFSLALFLGSFSSQWMDLSGLFWLTALLASIALLLVWRGLPDPPKPSQKNYYAWHSQLWRTRVLGVLKNTELMKLNASIFFLHTMLTALFVGMPVVLEMLINRGLLTHAWQCYLPVLVVSLMTTIPVIVLTEKFQRFKAALVGGVMVIILGLFVLWEQNSTLAGCFIGLWLFFSGFNSLEAILPSLVSRIAPRESKGTAMSFYACAQFFGIFMGGTLGGWLYSSSYINDIFLCLAALATVWLAIAYNMDPPRRLGGYTLKLAPEHLLDTSYLHKKLARIPGIEDIRVDVATGIAHLTIDVNFFDSRQVRVFEQ